MLQVEHAVGGLVKLLVWVAVMKCPEADWLCAAQHACHAFPHLADLHCLDCVVGVKVLVAAFSGFQRLLAHWQVTPKESTQVGPEAKVKPVHGLDVIRHALRAAQQRVFCASHSQARGVAKVKDDHVCEAHRWLHRLSLFAEQSNERERARAPPTSCGNADQHTCEHHKLIMKGVWYSSASNTDIAASQCIAGTQDTR